MKRAEREALMRQGVSSPETARDRRNLSGLAEDLRDSPGAGRALPLRLRNFRASTDAYLSSLGGPRAYMLRLRRIDDLVAAHRATLESAWLALAGQCPEDEAFAIRWAEAADACVFDDVNDLISRHNRWYPVESRLPMDPVRRDYVLVNGRDYRRSELDRTWVLEQFPPTRGAALARLTRSEASVRAS
jgi:hypothetical protein